MLHYDNDNKCQKTYGNIKVDLEQILAFASSTRLVRKVKNFFPNLIRIT